MVKVSTEMRMMKILTLITAERKTWRNRWKEERIRTVQWGVN